MSDTSEARPQKIAGVTVPLFSLRGARSWGIGEIGDLLPFAEWMRSIGIRLVQVLPLGEISGGETSPYSALSAFGIDPMFVTMHELEDLHGASPAEVLGPASARELERAQNATTIDYETVRTLKRRALRVAFDRFLVSSKGGPRAADFAAFTSEAKDWLDDLSLFRALKDHHRGLPWFELDAELKDRDPLALEAARSRLATDVAFHRYVQWIAHRQWASARRALASIGVEIMGDLPFMVARDSADVWANQTEFSNDRVVGAPPDQFNDEGQDWGLPPYAWKAMQTNDYAWLRKRARYTASLYDRFRIDHLVGFYRTYTRPLDARYDEDDKLVEGTFDPAEPEEQIAHGEAVIGAMQSSARALGSELIAEDLGIVPDAVRASLGRLGVAGYKVLIWEKDGPVFRDPRAYPARSVACFGTHDTDPIAVWWETRDVAERSALGALFAEKAGLAPRDSKKPRAAPRPIMMPARFTPELHRMLCDLIATSGSDLALYLIQDILGTRDRINTPATTGPANWTYRLPAEPAEMARDPRVVAATKLVHESLIAAGRAQPVR